MPDKILDKIIKDSDTKCWNWTGAVFVKPYGNYGQLRFGSKTKKAHRVSYEHFKGIIPKGLEIDHLCHNTLCVNPDHLEAVTHAENMKRRKDSGLSHCKYGHLYTEKTTLFNSRGRRECKTCRKVRAEEWYKKQPKKNCLECGNEISFQGTYCKSCYQLGDRNPQWKGGITKL